MKDPLTVYMVRTSTGKYYTGIAKDPENRIRQHNAPGSSKGAKCLRGQLPVVLVWTEGPMNGLDARRREYQIKQLSHAEKHRLQQGETP